MNYNKNVVGESIICNGHGIGEIVDVVNLQEGGELFYKVTFPKDRCINYFSIENKNKYRLLSSKKRINEAIKTFNMKNDSVEYKTIQEKITEQKRMLKEDGIVKLAKTLSLLNSEKELHPQISKIFKDSMSTFVDEIAFVLELKKSEVCSMLSLKESEISKR